MLSYFVADHMHMHAWPSVVRVRYNLAHTLQSQHSKVCQLSIATNAETKYWHRIFFVRVDFDFAPQLHLFLENKTGNIQFLMRNYFVANFKPNSLFLWKISRFSRFFGAAWAFIAADYRKYENNSTGNMPLCTLLLWPPLCFRYLKLFSSFILVCRNKGANRASMRQRART